MSRSAASFDWPLLMQFGFGVLRLAPRDFWSLTLPELSAAMKVHLVADQPTLSRGELDQLMQAYPDQSEEEDQWR